MVKPMASSLRSSAAARAQRDESGDMAEGKPVDPALAAVGGLPWLAEPLAAALAQQRAHALLVYGPEGVGQFEFALALARAWLCETPIEQRTAAGPADQPGRPFGSSSQQPNRLACGHCVSCHLVDGRSHPDLRLIVPEALRAMAGLAGDEADDAAGESTGARKRKPSREIKVEQVRSALDFSELSGARSGLRVVLIHPAEALNGISANALLKTLEEPPGDLRFILSCGAPEALLPTVRSRCQAVRLTAPPRELALRWLQAQSALSDEDGELLLDACADQVLAAQALAAAGLGAAAWRDLPAQLAHGDAAALAVWPLPELVDALQKLCHDLTLQAVGAPPRYFSAVTLAPLSTAAAPAGPASGVAPAAATGAALGASGRAPTAAAAAPGRQLERIARLTAWAADLRKLARRADHPWSAPLAIEALVAAARQAVGT
jgi:DNA polymerase-3 subunit delta'